MILVLAGTKDGRELALALAHGGYKVLLSAFSEYGGDLARQNGLSVRVGPLDDTGLQRLIVEHNISVIVDASHPYALNASVNAMKASQQVNKPYIRYERPEAQLPAYEKLHMVESAEQAAKKAAELGKVIFLTTGSRSLAIFKQAPALASCRVIARVLPDPGVLQECADLQFRPCDVIAMEGPFSHELNVALFKAYAADVIVTKNSGDIGGADTKISAAMELNLPLVVIRRPTISYGVTGSSIFDILQLIKEVI